MNIELSEEAVEYGHQASKAFEAAGGDELVQKAQAAPETRGSLITPILDELGALDLAPREDADQLEAAAALCRSAGYWALPYPVAERLSRPSDLDVDGLVVVADTPQATIGDLPGRWAAVDMHGTRSIAGPGISKAAFVADLALETVDVNGTKDLALALTLPVWTLLGMLDRALDLTIAHVNIRKQFGQTLSGFQSVQFQLTDGEVERSGLEMLARHTLWSLAVDRPDALDDALALRMAALEAAEVVFRVTHQLHGASGFCDETTLSWLSRYSQPLRRLPLGLSATRHLLTQRIGTTGLATIS